jgi:hypothetical protein
LQGNGWLTGLVGSLHVLGLMVVLWKGGISAVFFAAPALALAAAGAWVGVRLGSAVRG